MNGNSVSPLLWHHRSTHEARLYAKAWRREPGYCRLQFYSAAAIARGFDARQGDKVVVISPHNGLLAQHVAQAKEHTNGLGVAVRSLESIDLQGGIPEEADDFNILFVSIAAWHKLMDDYEAEVSLYFYANGAFCWNNFTCAHSMFFSFRS